MSGEQQEGVIQDGLEHPVKSCMFGEFKVEPIEDFGQGPGWYQVTLKVRPLLDNKPPEIPAEFLHQTIAEEMTTITLWTYELLRTGFKEILG